MSTSPLPLIQIAATDIPLSKGQKTFNSQIQQIEKLRARLAAWDAANTAYQKKFAHELAPLCAAARELQFKLVRALDIATEQKELTRPERRLLKELLVDLAGQLLDERDDAELKAIYNKHSRSDYDSEEAAGLQDMKDMIEGMFGIDLGGNEGLDSPEEVLRRAQAQFAERQEQHEAERQAREARRAKRKKSAKQQEKEERAEADARQVNQSLRAIYRKLASALHPDRESDPHERDRKTALMQRINQAYDKQNLLQLLELQLELEHIDRHTIGRLDEERLRHYNAILKKQIAELRHELMRVENGFCEQFGIPPFAKPKPETVLQELARDIVRVQQANREMERDLHAMQTAKGIKAWVKKLRRPPLHDDFDGLPF